MKIEVKSKLYGVIASVVGMLLLLLLLLFVGIQQEEEPEPEGITIAFGDYEIGGGYVPPSPVQPAETEVEPAPAEPAPSTEAEPEPSQLLTQQEESPVTIPEENENKKQKDKELEEAKAKAKAEAEAKAKADAEAKAKAEAEAKAKAEAEAEARAKAEAEARAKAETERAAEIQSQMASFNTNSEQGQGDQKGGTKNTNPAGHGTSNGHDYYTSGGRRLGTGGIVNPEKVGQRAGKIVVNFKISPEGKVYDAEIDQKASNISDKNMWNAALKAARATPFEKGTGIERGSITFHYNVS